MIRLLSRGEAAIKTGRSIRNPTPGQVTLCGSWESSGRTGGRCRSRDTTLGGLTEARRYICICGRQRASAGHQYGRNSVPDPRKRVTGGLTGGVAGACKALISQCPTRSFMVLIILIRYPHPRVLLVRALEFTIECCVLSIACGVGIAAVSMWSSAYAFSSLGPRTEQHPPGKMLKTWLVSSWLYLEDVLESLEVFEVLEFLVTLDRNYFGNINFISQKEMYDYISNNIKLITKK